MNIEDKIRKIQSLLRDGSASDGEKKAAEHLLAVLQTKYNIEPEQNDEASRTWCEIKCNNEYERSVLLRILDSYKIKPHLKKRHSKNLILFYTSPSYSEIIQAELQYHYSVLAKYLKSVTVNYVHKFILPYEIPAETKSTPTDQVTTEAAEAGSMIFSGKNYSSKKMLMQ